MIDLLAASLISGAAVAFVLEVLPAITMRNQSAATAQVMNVRADEIAQEHAQLLAGIRASYAHYLATLAEADRLTASGNGAWARGYIASASEQHKALRQYIESPTCYPVYRDARRMLKAVGEEVVNGKTRPVFTDEEYTR